MTKLIVKNILSKEYQVVQVMNGFDALSLLSQSLPDVVLLDGMMAKY